MRDLILAKIVMNAKFAVNLLLSSLIILEFIRVKNLTTVKTVNSSEKFATKVFLNQMC